MYNTNELLINIINPINQVKFIQVNPKDNTRFCGIDELGLFSENWELAKYMPEKEWNNV